MGSHGFTSEIRLCVNPFETNAAGEQVSPPDEQIFIFAQRLPVARRGVAWSQPANLQTNHKPTLPVHAPPKRDSNEYVRSSVFRDIRVL